MNHNIYFTPSSRNNIYPLSELNRNNRICFNKNIFLISILFLILSILLYNYLNKSNNYKHLVRQNESKGKKSIIDEVKITKEIIAPAPIHDFLKERDYNSLRDPLSAPTRRLPRHIYPVSPQDYSFDIPTQGYPDNYHYIGNLIRKIDEKIVKLFGRQTYPNSNKYEYYGITSDKNGVEIKISIKTDNNKELCKKDEINIDFLDNNTDKFILFMNNYDRPRYNPFIFH